MEYSVNTQPLLQSEETESDGEDEADTMPDFLGVDTRPLFKVSEPKDRYNLAYAIFYLLGMTTLLPWNFFITANDYWMYKFRNTAANVSEEDGGGDGSRTDLQASFTAYLSFASTIPNTLFLVLNSLLSHKISLKSRMVGSLGFMVVLFAATTVLVRIDTDEWQEIFFIVTLVIVALLNAASAVLQGGLFGLVGKFSSGYITAVVSGQALGGIFAAVAEILALCLGVSSTTSALFYFTIADFTLILAFISYFVLGHTIFFKFHLASKSDVSTMQYEPGVIQASQASSPPEERVSYTIILKKIWKYGFSVWLTFFITLAIYPAVTVLVNSTHKGSNDPWSDVYFVPVVDYLIFSLCDYTGRILAGVLLWPRGHGWIVSFLSVLRIGFVPLLLLCNAHPRHHLPVLINSDVYYILLIILFALSNGYLANITLLSVPRIVDVSEQETASSMMAAFLGIGLACGSTLSIAMVKLL